MHIFNGKTSFETLKERREIVSWRFRSLASHCLTWNKSKAFIKEDNLDIEKWVDEKTAVFLKIPDMDDTFNFLPLLIFILSFRTLEHKVDNEMGGEAKVPIEFLMDEFANLGRIPNIKQALSVFRSRRMSITILLQNVNQLIAMYKDDWKAFFGNCDAWVYLSGSTEPDTTKFFFRSSWKKRRFIFVSVIRGLFVVNRSERMLFQSVRSGN